MELSQEELALLAERLGNREAANRDELAALATQLDVNNQLNFLPGSDGLGTGGINSSLALNDALFGTNLSRSLGGQLNKTQNDLLALNRNNVLGNAIDQGSERERSFEKELRDQIDRAAQIDAKQLQDLQKQDNLDRDFVEGQRRADRSFGLQQARFNETKKQNEFNREQAKERSRLAASQRATRLGSGNAVGSNSIRTDQGLETFLLDTATQRFKGQTTKTGVAKRGFEKLDNISKTFTKELSINSRANAALSSIREARRLAAEGKDNTAALGAIVNQLARASGEVGALTEGDKSAFKGSQALQKKVARFLSVNFQGQINESDLADLERLAQGYLKESRGRVRSVTQREVRRLQEGLGIKSQDLLDAGILEYLGDGLETEDGHVIKISPDMLGLGVNKKSNNKVSASRAERLKRLRAKGF